MQDRSGSQIGGMIEMQIGEVIRKYRKEAGITQEEMAKRLGVTTPAVNKWENNNTQPDIALLSPIARLLNITTDTLLSFREELTAEEIEKAIRQIDHDLNEKDYAEVFSIARKIIEEYPNCFVFIWQAAVILEARLVVFDIPDADAYEEIILGWYERCLTCKDEKIRNQAASSLFHAYERKGQYDQALKYSEYLAREDPMRKRMEGIIYSKTERKEDAYRIFEEMLFADYQRIQLALNDLRMLYMEDGNHPMAHRLVEVSTQAAAAFDMGRYNEVCMGLDVAAWEKDAVRTEEIMRELIENVESVGSFADSELYRHLTFKKSESGFYQKLRENLIQSMSDDSFGYMRGNDFWEETINSDTEE